MTHRNEPHRTGPTATPLDLAAVQADETFIASLESGQWAFTENAVAEDAVADSPSAEAVLARLVLAWKQEIDAPAFPTLPTVAGSEEARPARRRRRLLTPVAAAAAAVGIALSGVALLAHDAHPGEPLWGVTQVVYADHARSVVAATDAQAALGLAQRALVADSPAAARAALERASTALGSVTDKDARARLAAQWSQLRGQLTPELPPAVSVPPPAAGPAVPAPPMVRVTTVPAPGPTTADPRAPKESPSPTPSPTTTPSPVATTTPAVSTTPSPSTTTATPEPSGTPAATTSESQPAGVSPSTP